MRRGPKIALRVLGGFLLLLLILIMAVPLVVPRDRLRAMAVVKIRNATGGEVSLGQVSLKVLPRLRLALGESRIVVTGEGLQRAGHQASALDSADVRIKELQLDLALMPLLKKRLEFGKIRLIGPDLAVTTLPPVSADSTGAALAAGKPAAAPSPWGLALAGVEVRDGHLLWRQSGTPKRAEVSGWRQDISGSDLGVLVARLQRLAGLPVAVGAAPDRLTKEATLGLTTTVDRVDLAGFGKRPLPPLTELKLEAEIGVGPAADRARFNVIGLTMPGWRATLAGNADRQRVTVTELNLAADEGAVDLSGNLAATLPPAGGPLSAALSGRIDLSRVLTAVGPWLPPQAPGAPPLPALTGTVSVALEASSPEAPPLNRPDLWQSRLATGLLEELTVTAEGSGLTVAAPPLGEPLRIARLDYKGEFGAPGMPQHVALRGLAHPAIKGDAQLDLRIGLQGAAHTADLKLGRIDLDTLTAIVKQNQPAPAQARAGGFSLVADAWAQPAAAARPVGEMIPPDLALGFTATAAEVRLMKTAYTGVKLRGDLTHRVVTVSSLRADLGDGDISGNASVDYANDPQGIAAFKLEASRVPASTLLALYVPQFAPLWEGLLSTTATGRCRLGEPATVTQSLSLAGNLTSAGGRIDLRTLLASVAPYLGSRQDLLRVTYTRYTQGFSVANGKVQVSDLRIDGRDTDWTGNGWIGLDGTLDLRIGVKLPAGFVPEVGELKFVADALKDDQGRIDLGFRISGEQKSPSVALDLPNRELQGKVGETVKDKVREGLGGLLDKLKRK